MLRSDTWRRFQELLERLPRVHGGAEAESSAVHDGQRPGARRGALETEADHLAQRARLGQVRGHGTLRAFRISLDCHLKSQWCREPGMAQDKEANGLSSVLLYILTSYCSHLKLPKFW